MIEKAVIMDDESILRALKRISHEIIEKNKSFDDVVIIGIQRRGVPIAKAISEMIYLTENVTVPVGILDITFYRDDLSLLYEHPVINGTQIDFSLTNKRIILVDDVLYTGRTARAAIDACIDIGRAKSIQLAVLVDRGHRELPIRADYVGKNVPTSVSETISVQLIEIDGISKVTICDVY